MPRTESFYTDVESERALSDPYLLEINGSKKTAIVTSALKEYYKNHRPEAEKPPQKRAPRVHEVKLPQ
jgi:hypothetical protein